MRKGEVRMEGGGKGREGEERGKGRGKNCLRTWSRHADMRATLNLVSWLTCRANLMACNLSISRVADTSRDLHKRAVD